MQINEDEKERLYKGLGLFQNAFRTYIISHLTDKAGDHWTDEFVETLSPQQKENWNNSLNNGASAEALVDFQHFKGFSIRKKDLLFADFANRTNNVPTWLGEIAEVRHKVAHFGSIEEDEATKAWIHMRTIARLIGMSELEQNFSALEKGKTVSRTFDLRKRHSTPTSSERAKDSFETLDIVNCAGLWPEVVKHRVYSCPVTGASYSHKQCKYLGAYWDKRVGAIAEIEGVVDVFSETDCRVLWINGHRDENEIIARAKVKAIELHAKDLPRRFFLLDKLNSTDFVKDSKGGMMFSKRYLNIQDLNVANSAELAQKLHGKIWSEFGL